MRLLQQIYSKDLTNRSNSKSSKLLHCNDCNGKKSEILQLKSQIQDLKEKLNKNNQKFLKPFGSSTSSAKMTLKENSAVEKPLKKGGAQIGHIGHKRAGADKENCDRVVKVKMPEKCNDCNIDLEYRKKDLRRVVDLIPPNVEEICYEIEAAECPCCLKQKKSNISAFDKCLIGNSLLSEIAVSHYVYGISIGQLRKKYGMHVSEGSIFNAIHRLGKICEDAKPLLINDFRNSLIRFADETGWRTDGKNGYAWYFGSQTTSIFEYGQSRSSETPSRIFGNNRLSGVTVVDRYAAYNSMPTTLQYCFSHLLRDLEDLIKDTKDNEIQDFVDTVAPMLAESMKLRKNEMSNEEYYLKAEVIADKIMDQMNAPAQSPAIKAYQDIFLDHTDRLFHWVYNRDIPAENNYAEREIRPTVIARKISFGSQSDRGAKTRSSITSVLGTARKRLGTGKLTLEQWLKNSLDAIVINQKVNIYNLLPIMN